MDGGVATIDVLGHPDPQADVWVPLSRTQDLPAGLASLGLVRQFFQAIGCRIRMGLHKADPSPFVRLVQASS